MKFKVFYQEQEQIDIHEGRFWNGFKNLAAIGTLGTIVGYQGITGKSALTGEPFSWNPFSKPAIQKPQDYSISKQVIIRNLIPFIKNTYHVDVNPNDIDWVKPIDAIKGQYGNQFQRVWQKAQQSQKVGNNSDIVTQTERLDLEIPIVRMNPGLFPVSIPGSGEKSGGFCSQFEIGSRIQRFCVMPKENSGWDGGTVRRHELSHSTQDWGKKFGVIDPSVFTPQENQFLDYALIESEIGVRLAEMKRNYFKMTGEVAEGENGLEDMWEHFSKNTKRYSYDVQQLVPLVNLLKKHDNTKGTKLVDEFFNMLTNNIDKMVKNDKLNTQGIS